MKSNAETPQPGAERRLDAEFWNSHWKAGRTGWDIGYASPPLVEFARAWKKKQSPVLIPGCGNAYEAEQLLHLGFSDITLVDFSEEAVSRLKRKFESLKDINILCENFFEHDGKYDLILEQTFFCALNPSLRKEYAEKMHSLLNIDGVLAGVMFNTLFDRKGPPFGGTENEYRTLFDPLFYIEIMEECRNSIAPRAGTELFVKLVKKSN